MHDSFERLVDKLKGTEGSIRAGRFGILFGPDNKFIVVVHDGDRWDKRFGGRMTSNHKDTFTGFEPLEDPTANEMKFKTCIRNFIESCHQEKLEEGSDDADHVFIRAIRTVLARSEEDEEY